MNAITITQSNDLAIFDPLPLDHNPAAVFLAKQKASTRRTYRGHLELLARLLTGSPDIFACNWAGLRYAHTQAIRAQLLQLTHPRTGEPLSPAYINGVRIALRGVLKTAKRLKQISTDDYEAAIDFENVRGSTLPAGRELTGGELQALLTACENDLSAAGARDAAIIALMYSCGLRRAEVITLDLADYDPETGLLKVRGKGNKERTAYLINGAALAMGDWLAIRGEDPGPLFWPVNKGGRLTPQRLTTQAIYNMLSKRGELARVRDFSPHDMRRTFVSDLLDKGADIATVAKMAGHASVTTTARYDRRPEAAKIKAAGLLHVPYHGRMFR